MQFVNGITLIAVSVPPVTTNAKRELVVPLVFIWKRELGPIESSWTMFVRIQFISPCSYSVLVLLNLFEYENRH